MTDKERTIKGLESLHDRLWDAAKQDAIATLDAHMVADALALLKEQPDIVRCKDCKHYEEESGICDLHHAHGYAETWFCADGERRETE